MKTKHLTQALERVESWPAQWQDQLAEIARDIDAEIKDGVYHPTPEEQKGIDRGLRDAEQGRFATEDEVEAAFAKFRGQ
jgi:predicted transcriptional regulator